MSELSCLVRQDFVLQPDPSRVLVRPFRPSTDPAELTPTNRGRANRIVSHVLALSSDAAELQLAEVIDSFHGRHRNLLGIFEARADEVEPTLDPHPPLTFNQRLLIGAYFLQEYSFEAAALFNPSIVIHPDQSGLSSGECRFVLSLRAVGEGHISSITFRTGIVDADGQVTVVPATRLAVVPRIGERIGDVVEVGFDAEAELSERVIFPVTGAQSGGIEDARFVRFEDENGPVYYGTYTAYSGREIRSELIDTSDFHRFRMRPMTGTASRNKGMALFPRKIGGRFAMVGRQDNENLFLMYSDDLLDWNGGEKFICPQNPWEFVQIGNCGSPIELDEGWLLFTHGVGAMRKYSIGAVLLDKDDPSKVIARTEDPLIRPEPSQREGYVPNVVYTCGALRHGPHIVLPYAVSDSFSNFASVRIDELLAVMKR